MRTVLDISNLKDKKVLLRVDFDVPVSNKGEIEENFRIKKQKEMIDWLVERGAKVVMVSHISAIDSFSNMIPQMHIILGLEIGFIKSVEEIDNYFVNYSGVGLLDNVRGFEGEKDNGKEFGEKLSDGFDLYINNAFAVSHREHASVSSVAGLLPSYAGLLMKEEVSHLKRAIDAPKGGKVIIIGGAKAETKVPVIKNFIDKAELILLGGVVANDVLKEKGHDIGNSLVDENSKELLVGLDINDSKLIVPEDFVIFDNKILDIGEKTIRKYADLVSRASMIVWNGPMGLFENPSFAIGTNELAKAIVSSNAYKIAGGGDTIRALNKSGIIGKFDFISTGGGAMLAFLAGQRLPGLEALGYYD